MKLLTQAAFTRARDFLKTQARPLERALFEHHFEGAPAEGALDALADYQNADGGFGRALEPDLRTSSSSALATGNALAILQELGVPAGHPLVQGALRYLVETFDRATLAWRVIPLDANDSPHAPWWHDEDGSLARTFGDYRIIPRARLVGFLQHYARENGERGAGSKAKRISPFVAPAWLDEVTEAAVAAVETDADLGSGGGDDLVYALSLAETRALPETYRQRLVDRLRAVVPQAVSRSPEAWSTYSVEPLKVAPAPGSLAAAWLEDILPANLDFRLDRQSPDGAWDPTWTWSGLYPDVWETARREWRGEITLHNLLSLRAFGRLER